MSHAAVRRDPRTWLAFVKFEHTLFALPFAYAGTVLAAGGWPGTATFAWVTLAMVGARTAAMAINRVVDAEIDARNPRTAVREIPAGRLTRRDGMLVAAVGIAAFTVAGLALNPLTAALLPVAVAFLVAYPYTKRVTWACHLWLGVTIGAAAAGGVIAVTGAFTAGAVALWVGVGAWIAGFDVIYALLDLEFDLREGVRSIPARFGPERAVDVAAALHALALAAFAALAFLTPLGAIYAVGIGAFVAPLLAAQQLLVRRRGPAAALQAFNANLWVSGLVLAAVVFDVAFAGGSGW